MRELQLCAYKYIFILIHYYIESENIYFLNDQVLISIVQSQGKKKMPGGSDIGRLSKATFALS